MCALYFRIFNKLMVNEAFRRDPLVYPSLQSLCSVPCVWCSRRSSPALLSGMCIIQLAVFSFVRSTRSYILRSMYSEYMKTARTAVRRTTGRKHLENVLARCQKPGTRIQANKHLFSER